MKFRLICEWHVSTDEEQEIYIKTLTVLFNVCFTLPN